MLVNNAKRFVVIPKINRTKFVIAHKVKENISPKETSAITLNGTYHITPSKGYDAMREVEVDVNIGQLTTEEKVVDITSNGEVEILPTNADAMTKVTANVQVPPPPLEEKQLTITKAKTTEIITPDAEYGLSRVEVSTDIPLESKQITITENGKTTIEASEGFEGIESVEVTSEVYDGFDLEQIGFSADDMAQFNEHYKNGINYAKKIAEEWDKRKKTFNNDTQLVFMPSVDYSGFRVNYLFGYCTNLESILGEIITFDANMYAPFVYAVNLRFLPIINCINITNYESFFYCCSSLKKIKLINTSNATTLNSACWLCFSLEEFSADDISGVINASNVFNQCLNLQRCYVGKWKQTNISLAQSSKLSAESIHYIIQNAVDLADGATARTLTLHATAKANWQNSEYYQQDLAVLSTKGITIA